MENTTISHNTSQRARRRHVPRRRRRLQDRQHDDLAQLGAVRRRAVDRRVGLRAEHPAAAEPADAARTRSSPAASRAAAATRSSPPRAATSPATTPASSPCPAPTSSWAACATARAPNPQLDALADNGGADADPRAARTAASPSTAASGPCPETDAARRRAPAERPLRRRRVRVRRPAAARRTTSRPTRSTSPARSRTASRRAPSTSPARTTSTPTDELIYECRLIEHDLTEAPEPQSPFEAIDPMLHLPVLLERLADRAVRGRPLHVRGARDRPRRPRSTRRPAHSRSTAWTSNPPDTIIVEKPPLRHQQPRRDVHVLRRRQRHAGAVPRVRVPARQPRPGDVAGVLQPDLLLQPDDRRSTRSRCARSTAPSSSTRRRRATRGPSACTAPTARTATTANITLTPTADGWVDEVNPVENYLFDRARGPLRRDRQPGGRAAGAGGRPERPHAGALPGADRRAGLRARVRDAAAVRRRA